MKNRIKGLTVKPDFSGPGVALYRNDFREIVPTIESECVHMIFTDPPYGKRNNDNDLFENREKALGRPNRREDLASVWERALGKGKPGKGRPIKNDGPEAEGMVREMIPMLKRVLVSGGALCCCCGGGGPDPQFARWSLWLAEHLEYKQQVIWDKGPMGMGWHYRRSYECVLVATKKGPTKWYDTTERVENVIRPGTRGIRKIIPGERNHPTEKPVELPALFVTLHTLPGEVVLDPFMGAGSTIIAALKNGRKAAGVELDEAHFAAAVDKVEKWLSRPKLFQ